MTSKLESEPEAGVTWIEWESIRRGLVPAGVRQQSPWRNLKKSCLAEASNEVSGACDKKQSEGQLEGGL